MHRSVYRTMCKRPYKKMKVQGAEHGVHIIVVVGVINGGGGGWSLC